MGSSSASSDHATLENEKDVEKIAGTDSKEASSLEPELGYENEKKTRSWFKRAPQDKLAASKKADPKKKAVNPDKIDHSLIKALNTTFFWRWWLAGILKLIGGTSRFS